MDTSEHVLMHTERPCVIIESPLRSASVAELETKLVYADCLMLDSIGRGEAPFLGHLLYPRVVNDQFEIERQAGIDCHLSWLGRASYIVVGMDLGEPTSGMRAAIDLGERLKISVTPRWLGDSWPNWIERIHKTPGFL